MDIFNILFLFIAIACLGLCIWGASIVYRMTRELFRFQEEVMELKQVHLNELRQALKSEEKKPADTRLQRLFNS